MSELEAEGILFLDDGLKGSVTYRNFHRPGKYSGWEKRGLTGAVALTKLRLLALSGPSPVINVPLTDKRLRSIHFSVEKDDRFCVIFDASLFHSDWSGTVEYRFRTEQALQLLDLVLKQIG